MKLVTQMLESVPKTHSIILSCFLNIDIEL